MIQNIKPYRYRLAVTRSNRYIYGSIVDMRSGKTMVSATDLKSKEKNRLSRASEVGEILAKTGLKKKITHVWFDRGIYRYHGRVKAFADGARKGGLQF